MSASVEILPEVLDALGSGRPVVALESAVLTHGLPRTRLPAECVPPLPPGVTWERESPANLAAARLLHRCVRAAGAVPAMVALLDGVLRIGLADDEVERLACDGRAIKAASRDLPTAMAHRRSGGTTVSATLTACRLCADLTAAGVPIRVFATGGIGGAHRGWAKSGDISADLRAIAETATCVVSAGAKSILDLATTVEMLESLAVPVIGLGTDAFPQFHSRGDESIPVPIRLDDIADVARACAHRWEDLGAGGVLLAVPLPESEAIDALEVETAMAVAEERARAAKVRGAALTPFLLDVMAAESGGRLVRANLALLAGNAAVAAALAAAIASRRWRTQ